MLLQLFSRRRDRHDFGSEFSELPVFDLGDCDTRRDWRLLAGGLALLLSRCPEGLIAREFAASAAAFRQLKRLLDDPTARSGLSAQLLIDLCHEISEHVDAITRAAALRCLERSRGRSH